MGLRRGSDNLLMLKLRLICLPPISAQVYRDGFDSFSFLRRFSSVVEQLIRNERVNGSNPLSGSLFFQELGRLIMTTVIA